MNYTLSYYFTELKPVLKYYQTLPYLNTLPKYLFTIALRQNIMPRRKNYAVAEYLSAGGIFIRGVSGREQAS